MHQTTPLAKPAPNNPLSISEPVPGTQKPTPQLSTTQPPPRAPSTTGVTALPSLSPPTSLISAATHP